MKKIILYFLAYIPLTLYAQSTFEREVSLPIDTLASTFYIKSMTIANDDRIKVFGRFYDAKFIATSGNFIADLDLEGNLSNIVYYKWMDPGNTIIKSVNGGYIIAGDDIDIGFLARVDEQGHILWQKHYENDDEVEVYETVETSNGDLLFTGEIDDFGDYHLLIKTDSNGDTLWTKMYLDDGEAYALSLLPDGGSVSTGDGWVNNGFGGSDIPVIRLDPDGNPVWMKIYGDSSWQSGSTILSTSNQSILVAGSTGQLPGDTLRTDQDAYFINLDMQGNILWSLVLDYNHGNEYVVKVIEDCSGDYIAALGSSNSQDSSGYAILMDISPSGQVVWSRKYGQPGNPVGVIDLIETPDDGFLVSTQTTTPIFKTKNYLIKTDSRGYSYCSDEDVSLQVQLRSFSSKDFFSQGWFPISVYPASFADGRDTIFGLEYSDYCARTNPFASDSLYLYPNPTQGDFQLYKMGCPDNSYDISIYNMAGQKVYAKHGEAGEPINKSYHLNLARGAYLLKFEAQDAVTVKKFIID